jgi:hypothetical protein
MLRIFVFCVAATAPAVTSRIGEERVDVATERVNAALDGLQKYFFDAKGQFWNAVCSHCSNVVCRSGIPVALLELLTLLRCAPFAQCGQNGGNGGKDPTNFTCTCESESPYCKNCFRWWMSTTMRACLLRVTWCHRGELSLQELSRESEACVHVAVMLPLLRGSFPLLIVFPPLYLVLM